jgi:glycosyltransferase involved in cell wall biosynthesis
MKKEKDEDIKLVIVGKKAWMYDDILKEACIDSEHILFTDYVSQKDLIRLYNAAQAFIYPSFFEGFGIPPLEAMACGTPVAVANATSLPEVVGKAGIYFDPFNEEDIQRAIYEITYDEESRKNALCNAVDQVKKFSWEKSAQKIINAYLETLNTGRVK